MRSDRYLGVDHLVHNKKKHSPVSFQEKLSRIDKLNRDLQNECRKISKAIDEVITNV